ncbi:hypothetical protein [Streptomyces sp. BK340]|uniref:hypothetical protein n=1 Tax=Streptomyces sp. BK340 TaxID=2572903 RepID=UPI0011A909C8|nr:hypothetical protein [Streptomyces sp. BK340]TVZ93431.1 hypothetical protein FB157_106153 [Streptomyces sp. BK340]
MGERHSGDEPGRRRGHPGGTVLGPAPADRTDRDPAFEALLGAALSRGAASGAVDPEAERRAVAAFRAARDSGAHALRTRRRDDWRPRQARGARLSLKATLSVFLASVALGGVAFAAIDSVGSRKDDAGQQKRPSASAPGHSSAEPAGPGSAGASARPHHPATAKDTLAHCRAYEQVKDHGKALDATAWQRLVTAAGGQEKVAGYCAERIARADGATGNKNDKNDKSDKTRNSGNGRSSSDSSSGNGSGSGKGDNSGKAGVRPTGSADPGKSGGKK